MKGLFDWPTLHFDSIEVGKELLASKSLDERTIPKVQGDSSRTYITPVEA
jgi:hypothetical protein